MNRWGCLDNGETSLEIWLKLWTGYLASGVEGMGGLLIVIAALQATIRTIWVFLGQRSLRQESQVENIRLCLARWLALALEFELGADILRTAIAPTWTDIGQLAAIATIRTLLNYFLHKEIDRAIQWQQDHPSLSYIPPTDRLEPQKDH